MFSLLHQTIIFAICRLHYKQALRYRYKASLLEFRPKEQTNPKSWSSRKNRDRYLLSMRRLFVNRTRDTSVLIPNVARDLLRKYVHREVSFDAKIIWFKFILTTDSLEISSMMRLFSLLKEYRFHMQCKAKS